MDENLIKIRIPLDQVWWLSPQAEKIWLEVDDLTYQEYKNGKIGGPYYGMLRNDSYFFPKSLEYGTYIPFMLTGEEFPESQIVDIFDESVKILEDPDPELLEAMLSGDGESKIKLFCEDYLSTAEWFHPHFQYCRDCPRRKLDQRDIIYSRFQDFAWSSMPIAYKKYFQRTHDVPFCEYAPNYVSVDSFQTWYLKNEDNLVNSHPLMEEY